MKIPYLCNTKNENMIDQATIQRILDATDIVEVVSEFVTLRKRGVNYVGLCPFHNDKTPSFYVSPTKGVCKCFACGKGGSAVHFLMEHHHPFRSHYLDYWPGVRQHPVGIVPSVPTSVRL